jgi:two-component system, cell cycle sensor histidine kinase and response regulator CckA
MSVDSPPVQSQASRMPRRETQGFSPFPRRMLTVCLALTVLLLVGSMWQRWIAYERIERYQKEDYELQALAGVITHWDEVLTMSARMAAATRDLAWEKRYRDHEPQLDSTIRQVIRLARDQFMSDAANETNAANLRLVEMEHRAFGLVRAGRPEEAMALLVGPEYADQKQIYAGGMKRITDQLKRRATDKAQASRRVAYVGSAFSLTALLFTLVVWARVICSINRHMAERKQAEVALRESEKQLQQQLHEIDQIYKFSPVGLSALDRGLHFLRLNEQLAEIDGMSVEEHLGRTIPEIVPDLAERLQKLWQPIFERGEPVLNIEVSGTTAKAPGVLRHWLCNYFPTTSATGEVTGLMAAVVEITDRKQAEELLRESEAKYRALIEVTDTGFQILDGEGRVIDANQEYVRQTGHTSLAEIMGRQVSEWTADHDLARNVDELHNCMAKGFARNLVLDYLDKANQITTIEINATVVRTEEGTRILALSRDITDRKRMEKEREQLQAQLRQAQKMEAVGRLSGGIAHDFNNLLTVILGNAEVASLVLQEGMTRRDVDKVAAALEQIGQAAERAAGLTSQLLTFSRKHVTHVHVLDMDAVVHDVEKMLRRLVREDIAYEITCEPGEHLIQADQTQIEQVLVNLAINASDAMPDGGKLTMRVSDATLDEAYARKHAQARTGPHVLITVTDTGIGMDSNTLEHLFEPFFTTKPYGQGTGLGLSIVYGIVKNAGGHITVESNPGKGSTFKLYIPAAQGAASKSVETPAPAWQGGDERILLCEDEVSLRRLAVTVLKESGYTVIEAENGEQAVRLAADYRGTFQLLITDVIMPGMKGDKVAAAILKDHPDVQVLFISGYASDVLSAQSITEGGLEFLQKPFKPEVLLRRVREILNKTKK